LPRVPAWQLTPLIIAVQSCQHTMSTFGSGLNNRVVTPPTVGVAYSFAQGLNNNAILKHTISPETYSLDNVNRTQVTVRFNMVLSRVHILPELLMNCNFLLYSYCNSRRRSGQPLYFWSALQESNSRLESRSFLY
jgi:hypothetical protein